MNEESFRALINGDRRGVTASLARGALSVASTVYGCGVSVRNQLFDREIKRVHRAAVPVISVGNITAGGTGKTPFVAYLTRLLTDRGIQVGLLSRGYRAHSAQGNDEKLVLDQLCPDVPHVQDKNRVAAAVRACEKHGCELLILDDGFQHRRLHRDLDIVLIDALNPWGYGHLLPRGLLRESLCGLRRADTVVITRVDQANESRIHSIRERITEYTTIEHPIEVAFPPLRLINSERTTAEFGQLSSNRILGFCGIGNPDSFRKTLEQTGFDVGRFEAFPDHHVYSELELSVLGDAARTCRAESLICTQKDLVKIRQSNVDGIPIYAIEIGTQVVAGSESLDRLLTKAINCGEE